MSTLLDLIQTKVNYVVQEAIVVIRDIFRKYPNKYAAVASDCFGSTCLPSSEQSRTQLSRALKQRWKQ